MPFSSLKSPKMEGEWQEHPYQFPSGSGFSQGCFSSPQPPTSQQPSPLEGIKLRSLLFWLLNFPSSL